MTSLGELIALVGFGIFIGLFITEKYRVVLAVISIVMIASPLIASMLLDIYSWIKLRKHAGNL